MALLRRDICDGQAAVQKLRNGGDIGILVFSAILALHSSLTVTDIPAKEIQENDYFVHVKLPKSFDVLNDELISGNLEDTGNYVTCGSYRLLKGNDGCWYAVLRYDQNYIKGVIFVDLDLIKAAAGDLALVPLEIEGNVAGDLGIGSIRACGCLLFLLDITINPDETPDEDKKTIRTMTLTRA